MIYLCSSFLLTAHHQYIRRCLELAASGAGQTAPNPMVGAVLLLNGRIIAEGYHQRYGEAHAERNCINQAIQLGNESSLPLSTLYVSLEPCAHYGKTPPCADLIIKHRIPRVIIGCSDPFKEVDGKGIEKLRMAGIELEVGILEKECKELNKRFFTFHSLRRPYVVLKWAQTKDGFIASADQTVPDSHGKSSRLHISNEFSSRLVHQWRGQEASILVGTNTALMDNPSLTTRLWPGKSALRLVVDMDLRLPSSFQVFDGSGPTIIFNKKIHSEEFRLPSPRILTNGETTKAKYWQVTEDTSLVHQIMNALYSLQVQSVIVEGGAMLLQSFIDDGSWDEARVITNNQMEIGRGLPSPQLSNANLVRENALLSDTIQMYHHSN
jgi:diaminohydroxyphosphoribosylaminopyrimidine deaminase/5-amino-6-(5-phosphoribosylamino)uracil reductase